MLGEKEIDQVSPFKYLGNITDNENSKEKIKCRIKCMTRSHDPNNKKLLTAKNIMLKNYNIKK